MAALAVAKAAPDGYTLLLTGTNHATNPTLIPTPASTTSAISRR